MTCDGDSTRNFVNISVDLRSVKHKCVVGWESLQYWHFRVRFAVSFLAQPKIKNCYHAAVLLFAQGQNHRKINGEGACCEMQRNRRGRITVDFSSARFQLLALDLITHRLS
eukprot:g41155.t1